jgi:hypothetical protein
MSALVTSTETRQRDNAIGFDAVSRRYRNGTPALDITRYEGGLE